ncbi:MAG: putative chemoreceptor glutamine deamidase CheD [Candidatus Peregrinibacteria bacterium GW2011_GWA2_47_7]|nr:MAG: putative chemoreceptor glutamine deamidase CheD [Candidatus Peregrinibacteria bacterium GW2011_GWA2_47_7]
MFSNVFRCGAFIPYKNELWENARFLFEQTSSGEVVHTVESKNAPSKLPNPKTAADVQEDASKNIAHSMGAMERLQNAHAAEYTTKFLATHGVEIKRLLDTIEPTAKNIVEAVKRIQESINQKLLASNKTPLKVDGVFGALTMDALKRADTELYSKLTQNTDQSTTEINDLLNAPEYRHLHGINYLFVSPFIRIEHETSRDSSSLIRVVKRGIKDGENDQILNYIFINNGEFTTAGGSPLTKPIPVPLEEDDKNRPIIKYLLSKHAIESTPVQLNDSATKIAKEFFSIRPSLPQQRNTVPLKDIKPDHNVGMSNYAVDKGEKKIVTVGLANCVGLTIYDPETHTGGIAHFDPNIETGNMFDQMVNEFGRIDSSKTEIRLIGGWSGYSERTVYYLRQNLESRGLKVTSEDILGEDVARSIMLNTASGEVTYLNR